MTAKEIRLGNIVNYKYWNPNPKGGEWCFEMVEIVGLLQDTFYFKFRNNNSVKKIKELYPIELTEGILLKCGFEWSHYHPDTAQREYYINNDFGIELFNERYYKLNTEIKYLHQLQNLYFALTGEELEIKL